MEYAHSFHSLNRITDRVNCKTSTINQFWKNALRNTYWQCFPRALNIYSNEKCALRKANVSTTFFKKPQGMPWNVWSVETIKWFKLSAKWNCNTVFKNSCFTFLKKRKLGAIWRSKIWLNPQTPCSRGGKDYFSSVVSKLRTI